MCISLPIQAPLHISSHVRGGLARACLQIRCGRILRGRYRERWWQVGREKTQVWYQEEALDIRRLHRGIKTLVRLLRKYSVAQMLLKFLAYFKEFPDDEIPPTSILREFLSGISFKYRLKVCHKNKNPCASEECAGCNHSFLAVFLFLPLMPAFVVLNPIAQNDAE